MLPMQMRRLPDSHHPDPLWLSALWEWNVKAPLEVELTLWATADPDPKLVPWSISRDLVADGLDDWSSRGLGSGDVQVRAVTEGIAELTITSHQGTASMRFDSPPMRIFLAHTFVQSPRGAETERLDWGQVEQWLR